MCVVDDPKLDEILTAISNVACAGTKCDEKIFVTIIDIHLMFVQKNMYYICLT